MNDIRRLDTKLLLAFDAVMEERSVSRAAVRLRLTQQGLSGVLNRLRDLFEDPLFVREARGVSPTPRAEALAPRIKAALASLEGVLEAPEFVPATAEGTIHVMTTDFVSSAIMPSLFRQFRLLAPNVKLAVMPISQTAQRERMHNNRIDLILAIAQFAPQGWRTCRLFKQGYLCAMRAGHPLAGSGLTLDEFCGCEHILVSPYNSDFNGPTDKALARIGRTRNVGLVIPSFAVVGEFLEHTDLIAVLPERVLSDENNRVFLCPPPVELTDVELVAAWPERLNEDPLHKWFRKICFEFTQKLGVGD